MRRFCRNLSFGALTVLLTAASASAQLSTAELSGRVTDTSNAVLPGVTVTMTQTDTQATRTAITDADGSYVISSLPTGPYRLEVSLQGFRSFVQNGIVLQVGATPTINVVLEVGSVAETITVRATLLL
jgi:Carboxypeptidase regulatory-like domain